MNVCEDILNSCENKSIELNDEIYDLVLQEFLSRSGQSFSFESLTPGAKVRWIKNHYIYISEYVGLFFEIMEKHGYNMRLEIVDAIFNLGHLVNKSQLDEVIKVLIKSPVIQDIRFNGKNRFVIFSERYGHFSFELASYYFRELNKNRKITNYMKKNELAGYCHDNTIFLSIFFPDFHAITSFCPSHFVGTRFHSYTKSRNSVIDLCYNCIMDIEQYYRLFQPQEISTILNSEIIKELITVNLKTDQEEKRCALLKIALYKQYLNNINYQGGLRDAPSTIDKELTYKKVMSGSFYR